MEGGPALRASMFMRRRALQDAPEQLRVDKEVVLAAVAMNGECAAVFMGGAQGGQRSGAAVAKNGLALQ